MILSKCSPAGKVELTNETHHSVILQEGFMGFQNFLNDD